MTHVIETLVLESVKDELSFDLMIEVRGIPVHLVYLLDVKNGKKDSLNIHMFIYNILIPLLL
jgi:hypothetical protein